MGHVINIVHCGNLKNEENGRNKMDHSAELTPIPGILKILRG
jgi:hypothetical protein